MDQWYQIRQQVLVEGRSKRSVQKEHGLHWKTLQKILNHSAPPGYGRSPIRPKPKLGPYLHRIEAILREDKAMPRKQRHTAKRIWQRLKEEGYSGSYTQVREAVADLERKTAEVFVPLRHDPGEAQVDFGEALVNLTGELTKVKFMVMALPYSDAFFVMAFERECTETFWEGHVQGFEYFGGVPRKIIYDNSRIAVSNVVGMTRELTRGFLELKSHYLFDHRFCRVRRANEKGVVEGAVKYTRLNFLVPVPQMRDLDELNRYLRWCVAGDLERRVRGAKTTKAELLKEDQAAFLPLPASRFDACRKQQTHSSSLSLVRFDDNDYSVPVSYAHHEILVKGYVNRVDLFCQGEKVAEHLRIWERERVKYNPVHYLALLERKPGAFAQACPLEEWELPEVFFQMHGRLERRLGESEGTREYIKVLRLLEKHPYQKVKEAIEKALEMGAVCRDAIAQFLYPSPQIELFSLDGHPHLRQVRVEAPDLKGYSHLMGGRR